MILKSLVDYYQTLAENADSGVSQIGYSKEQISFALVISKSGCLSGLLDLRNGLQNRIMDVPQHIPPRACNVLPYFLCDYPKYLLGLGSDKAKKQLVLELKKYEASKAYHLKMLKDVNDERANAIKAFFITNTPSALLSMSIIKDRTDEIAKSSNLVFILEGDKQFIHERSDIKRVIESNNDNSKDDDGIDLQIVNGQCSVSGQDSIIPSTHGKIKGVRGTKQLQGAIVSFNREAYKSYGKDQNHNASVGKEAAFAYVTALNSMLSPTSIQNTQIGDTTTVFWAERYGTGQEELIYALFNPTDVEEAHEDDSNKKSGKEKKQKEIKKTVLNDQASIRRMRDFLGRVAQGKGMVDLPGFNPNVKFNILGLAPNAARISIRFFYADTFGNIVDKISQHYEDMLIEKQYVNEKDAIAVWQLLRETAAQGKSENIPPAYSGGLMRAILSGGMYPVAVYQAILNRIGIDKTINRNRVALIKAYLTRNNRIHKKKGGIQMSLNTDEKNVGYCLGRLFALLEKAQSDASPGITTTIKDRYFGTASASPKAIFPVLMRLAQHHISGAKYGQYTDKQIEEVLSSISAFPAHLNLDDQGMFMLGYYHQRNVLYKKKEDK